MSHPLTPQAADDNRIGAPSDGAKTYETEVVDPAEATGVDHLSQTPAPRHP